MTTIAYSPVNIQTSAQSVLSTPDWFGEITLMAHYLHRQVSLLLHPLVVGSAPLLWRDWSRRLHRRVCLSLLRQQRVEVQVEQGLSPGSALAPAPLSRAQRAQFLPSLTGSTSCSA
jgi:hypothetical protein